MFYRTLIKLMDRTDKVEKLIRELQSTVADMQDSLSFSDIRFETLLKGLDLQIVQYPWPHVEPIETKPNNSLQPTPTSDVDLPDTPTRQGINMTQLLDTEGQTIPTEDGILLFNADLCDWGDGKGPDLTLNIPMYFKTEEGIYDGSGVISAPLKDVLEEYLQNFMKEDGGIGINDFVAWLHDYADRLKTARHAAHAG